MTLLAPLALWLLPVVGAVAALYLLKVRRRRQTVPALELWTALVTESSTRSLFDRFKRWLSMLLWILIVLLLILALANPLLAFGKIKPGAFVIVLDNSASMRTIEGEQTTRYDLALGALESLTSRRPVADEWLLLEAGNETRVAQGWTREAERVRDAARGITPHAGANDISGAIAMARQLLEGKERPRIVVLSDGASADWLPEEADGDGEDVTPELWSVGETIDNLGITRLAVRPHRQRGVQYAYIRVVNASQSAVNTTLLFAVDGVTRAAEPLEIEPGAAWERTLEFEEPAGGVLTATIDRDDGLHIDNVAHAVMPEIMRARIVLVSGAAEAYFLERALSAMDTLIDAPQSVTITPGAYATFVPETAPDLTIFNGWSPETPPDAGSALYINAVPPGAGVRTVGDLEGPRLRVTERAHPVMRGVTLRGATLAAAREVDVPADARILAQTDEGLPLIYMLRQLDRVALCIAFDPLESDLPFRNAFPLMLRNAVAALVTDREPLIPLAHDIGGAITTTRPLPERINQVGVSRRGSGGGGEPITLPVTEGVFRYAGLQAPGVLRFEIGDMSVATAINLTDASETINIPAPGMENPEEALGLSGALFGGYPWFTLAVCATMLVALEWVSYNMRWTE